MRVRSAAPLAIAAIVAAGSLSPAHAAPKKKPIKKTYSLTLAPLPDATEVSGCDSKGRTEDVNMDTQTLKVTGPGTLALTVSGFSGDWDASILNSSGANVSQAAGTSTPNTSTAPGEDTLKYKSKKAQTLTIQVCNFAGSPAATVTYTYTYL